MPDPKPPGVESGLMSVARSAGELTEWEKIIAEGPKRQDLNKSLAKLRVELEEKDTEICRLKDELAKKEGSLTLKQVEIDMHKEQRLAMLEPDSTPEEFEWIKTNRELQQDIKTLTARVEFLEEAIEKLK